MRFNYTGIGILHMFSPCTLQLRHKNLYVDTAKVFTNSSMVRIAAKNQRLVSYLVTYQVIQGSCSISEQENRWRVVPFYWLIISMIYNGKMQTTTDLKSA